MTHDYEHVDWIEIRLFPADSEITRNGKIQSARRHLYGATYEYVLATKTRCIIQITENLIPWAEVKYTQSKDTTQPFDLYKLSVSIEPASSTFSESLLGMILALNHIRWIKNVFKRGK